MLNEAVLTAIVDRARPDVAWCEACGAIAKPEGDERDVVRWHTNAKQDPNDGSAVAVQCGPMHMLAIVTDNELREIKSAIVDAATSTQPPSVWGAEADRVVAQAEYYKTMWQGREETFWLARMVQEIGELASALVGDHKDSPEHELRQIGSIAINWLRLRQRARDLGPDSGPF